MPPEVRARLFEPFFTTKGDRGTGLGLATVHAIVQRHGGTIGVRSTPGAGTTFAVQLPLRAAETSGATLPRKRAATVATRPLPVLLAEDEPGLRRLVTRSLSGVGHSVVAVADGRAALEAFRRGVFDLVISDRAMPEMDGVRLAAEIKALSPTTPVVLLTGFGDLMRAAGEQPAAVDAVVPKPVTSSALLAAVADVVG
jgi:CheY-like chemotaxis protein